MKSLILIILLFILASENEVPVMIPKVEFYFTGPKLVMLTIPTTVRNASNNTTFVLPAHSYVVISMDGIMYMPSEKETGALKMKEMHEWFYSQPRSTNFN